MYERKKPLVSIVCPCWFKESQDGKYGKNETLWIAWQCLNKLKERTPRDKYELILIDNGSSIDTEVLSLSGEKTSFWEMGDVVIRNKINIGFAPSCNQGFSISRGEYVCCINNDIVVYDDWLDKLLEPFKLELSPSAGMVMPALMKETRSFNEAIKINHPDLSHNYDRYGQGAEFGSCWMAKNETLKEVAKNRDGYQIFDENFLLGMGEDRWLYQEIRKLGLETYRTHKTRVFHVGNATIGKVKDRKDYTEKNRKYLNKLKNSST